MNDPVNFLYDNRSDPEHRSVLEDWERTRYRTLPCRRKIRHVLGHGVAFSPGEIAAITGHKVNSVISTLARMRARGEVTHEGHGRWVGKSLLERVA